VVQEKEMPDGVPESVLELGGADGVGLLEALERLGLTSSRSEARRLVAQGTVELDGASVADPALRLAPGEHRIKVGKRRFARLRLR
jgi:tyrosyl-tRNA synthetase